MLEDIYKSYRKKAEAIDWKKYNQNELFFKCIEHENDDLFENFYAGIVCRYWGYSGRIYRNNNRHIPFEECYDCVIDSIKYVLEKRVWENRNSSLYGDSRAPDKAMHMVMKRQNAVMLAKYSAYRRLSNFNTLSIDQFHEDYNDSADGLLFELSSNDNNINYLISDHIKNKRYIEAIIIDLICYGKYSRYNENKIISLLRKITLNDYEYFHSNYSMTKKAYISGLKIINNSSTELLKNKIRSTLHHLKEVYND